MSLGEFVDRVAERADVSLEGAREYVRAVLKTLRDAVRRGYTDVTVQLPDEYVALMER